MPFIVACIQTEPVFGDVKGNIDRLDGLIAEAVTNGAEMIVAPELCNTGYMFNSKSEALELAEEVPKGWSCSRWVEAARRHTVTLVAGICEIDNGALYNSSVMVGPDGVLALYRKVHLWDAEKLIFQSGNLGFPVAPTPLGQIGMFICYDNWFPESYRSCALAGADLVCIPTNWVPIPGQRHDREAMANILVMAAAHSNGINVAAANRVGVERGQPFIGQSLIVDHTGWPIGGPASADKSEIIYGTIDVEASRASRKWGDFNVVVGDRRPDQYHNQGNP